MSQRWGTGVGLSGWAPSVAEDDAVREDFAQFQRMSASPADVRAIFRSYEHIDVRHALNAISAPTLVIHRTEDRMVPVELGRYIAEHVQGARLVELPGTDHVMWTEGVDAILGEVEEFLTGVRHGPPPARRLAAILFTDIVGSTEAAARLGDRAWRDLLARHDAMIERALERFGGRIVQSTGDGVLAIFGGPSAAIQCAEAIRGGASAIGLQVRAGIHSGEIEFTGAEIRGIGVHIARRVADLAAPDEVWVSATVPGMAVGSLIGFADRGRHTLKGVPGEWHLFAAGRL